MIYIFTFAASIFFAYLAERSKNKDMIILYSVISILIPSILGGIRATGIGTDTRGYGSYDPLNALNSPDIFYFIENTRTELGWKIFIYFVMHTFGHVNWTYFFEQLITMSCIYIGAWRHRKISSLPFTLFVFFTFFYNQSYNAIRQYISVAIMFMGLNELEEKHYVKYFICYVIIATSFHYSSLLVYMMLQVIYVLASSEKSDKYHTQKTIASYVLLGVMLISQPLIVFITSHISFMSAYARYSANWNDNSRVFLSNILLIAGQATMFTIYKKGAMNTFSSIGEGNFNFHIYSSLFILFYLLVVRFWTGRVLILQQVINIILLASLPRFVKEKNLRFMVLLSVTIVGLYFFWLSYIHKGASHTWPYRSIL